MRRHRVPEKGTAMPFETILYETSGRIATVTLNRPEKLNTIRPPMPDELEAAVRELRTPTPRCA